MVTLHVHDLDRALTFYRDQLGLRVKDVVDVPGVLGWAEVEVNRGLVLGPHHDRHGGEPDARPPGGPSGFYFQVPDVDAAIAKLRAKGVRVTEEPADKSYGRDACIADPDGNEIALMTPS